MGVEERARMRVAVLCGGISSEAEISRCSGANAHKALLEAGYGTVDMLDPADDAFLDEIRSGYDAAFISLHGRGGEDGMIQHLLEYLGIPYTGSDATASACAADKSISKVLYREAGVPIARGRVFASVDECDTERAFEELGSKLFVKPAVNGSSYGVSKAETPEELSSALATAFEYDDKVLVEECLEGVEITVGVYGGCELTALPVVEIRMPSEAEFYDLSVKYVDPTDIHRIPAQIPEKDYRRAQELAIEAHRALGCYGISRSDFIVTSRGPVILETNTIPGHTDTSLYPDEVRHAGMTFSQVCAMLVDLALERANR